MCAVQRVGRLPDRGGAARAPVGEQHGLEHLVGAVGDEDLLGSDIVELADGGPQLGGGAVGVAVPVDRPATAAGQLAGPALGWRRLG